MSLNVDCPPVFHMCDEDQFNEQTQDGKFYYPPTYDADKFIHATLEPKFLLDAGNHFYKSVIGNWICIKLNPIELGGEVIFEAPASVGDIKAFDYVDPPKFPHIYGGIPKKSVIEIYKIKRGDDGTFLSIEGLIE